MNFKFLSAIALLLGLTNPLNAMPFDPVIGTWKVIDDRTGSYISDIVVRKDSKTEQYSAVVTKNYPLLGKSISETCVKCQGALKDQPIFGMETLRGLVADSDKQRFRKGVWINTQDGQVYNIDARLSVSGDQLKVQGKAKSSNTMSNMTWKKL